MRRWLGPVDLAPLPTLLLGLAAVAVAIGGFEHARLYHDGYSEISTIGTLFLLNAIGSLLTVLLLIARRPLPFIAGSLVISVGSIVALVLTRTTGLFGFEESGYDGAAIVTLLAEIAAVALTLAGGIVAGRTLIGEGTERAQATRHSRDPAARALAGVVVTLVLGVVIVGVGQGDDGTPQLRGGAETTTGPSGGTAPPTTTDGETPAGGDQPAVSAAVLDRGRALFSDRCAGCHTLADAESTGRIGPDLDQVVPGRSAEKLHEDLVDPGAETTEGFPAGRMPSFDDLSEQQLDDLVAYLMAVTR